MTREKGEMLKTGYLEVVHDQELQLVIGEVSDDDFMTREKGEVLKNWIFRSCPMSMQLMLV